MNFGAQISDPDFNPRHGPPQVRLLSSLAAQKGALRMFRAAVCPVLGPLVDVGDFLFAQTFRMKFWAALHASRDLLWIWLIILYTL